MDLYLQPPDQMLLSVCVCGGGGCALVNPTLWGQNVPTMSQILVLVGTFLVPMHEETAINFF